MLSGGKTTLASHHEDNHPLSSKGNLSSPNVGRNHKSIVPTRSGGAISFFQMKVKQKQQTLNNTLTQLAYQQRKVVKTELKTKSTLNNLKSNVTFNEPTQKKQNLQLMDLIEKQSHTQNETVNEAERIEDTISSPNENERGFSIRQEDGDQTISPGQCNTQPPSLIVSPVASSANNREKYATLSHGSRNQKRQRHTTTFTQESKERTAHTHHDRTPKSFKMRKEDTIESFDDMEDEKKKKAKKEARKQAQIKAKMKMKRDLLIPSKYEPIIDYPRHVRVSSAQPDIGEAHNMMREQQFFHHKYNPELANYANRHLFKGFYSPNQEFNQQEINNESVLEYIRRKIPENVY